MLRENEAVANKPPVSFAAAGTVSGIEVQALQPCIGARIVGLDLREPFTDAKKNLVRAALLKHGVIFIPKQDIDDATFMALGESLGELVGINSDGGGDLIGTIKAAGGSKNGTVNVWHSDLCYMPEPTAFTLLRSMQAPELGGDTCFASAVAVYADLSDALKERIKPLKYRSSLSFIVSRYARHSDPKEMEERAKRFPVVEQPVVRIHPETGAPVLYVNESQTMEIVGMEGPEGAALIRQLTDLFKRPEYQMRWKWSQGDIGIWDNRAVQHYAVSNPTTDRVMQRMNVAGTRPIGAYEL